MVIFFLTFENDKNTLFSIINREEGDWDQSLPSGHYGWRCCWLLILGACSSTTVQVDPPFIVFSWIVSYLVTSMHGRVN